MASKSQLDRDYQAKDEVKKLYSESLELPIVYCSFVFKGIVDSVSSLAHMLDQKNVEKKKLSHLIHLLCHGWYKDQENTKSCSIVK